MARVLVIGDNLGSIGSMVSFLRALGHEPVSAASGAAAILAAADQPVDVVLLDIQIPGMDGFETARALRRSAALAEVPLVALTALAMPRNRELILDAGFSGYIATPIDLARLAGQIASFLPPDTGGP